MRTQEYPFDLTNTLFTRLSFARKPEVASGIELPLSVQIRSHEDKLPSKLQLDLRIETEDSTLPITFSAEVVGLFDLIPGYPEPTSRLVRKFIEDRGLYMLWASINQMVRYMTAQMGLEPIGIKAPLSFKLPLTKKSKGSEGEKINQ